MGSLDRRSGPLYRRVADDILDQIHSGTLRPGDKLPSERALCDLYQVSQITVRRALRELRHSGLLVSRHGLGWYVQNGAAHRGETPEAVLVLPEMDWLAATLVRHLAEEIAKGGQALRLSFTGGQPEAEDEALEAARGQGAAAVLAIADGEEQALAERYARFLGGDTPLLLLVREVEASGAPAAYWDQEAAVAMATRHLLDLGHQRIAYAGGDPDTLGGQRCYWGFANSLWDRGLDLPLDWVFTGPGDTYLADERLDAALRGAPRPTAVVCADDLIAAGVMSRLGHLDLRCPNDVAMVSVGDRDFCPVLPTPLTRLRPDLRGLARAAASMARDLAAGRAVQSARFVGSLVQRQSSGAALPPR